MQTTFEMRVKEKPKFVPRDYQEKSIQEGLRFLQSNSGQNEIHVLPTGAGKSICVAGIADRFEEPILILQPSQEILKQNYAKYVSYGGHAGIYSASVGRKDLGHVTFASIQSIMSRDKQGKYPHAEKFKHFRHVIIDECFPAGTMIGEIPIENIRVGDLVDSFNHEKGVVEKKRVVRLFKNKAKGRLMKVQSKDGAGFICTENHPIYTDTHGYISPNALSLIPLRGVSIIRTNEKKAEPVFNMRKFSRQENIQGKANLLFREVYGGRENGQKRESHLGVYFLREGNNHNGLPEEELPKDRFGLLFCRLRKKGEVEKNFRKHEKNDRGRVVHNAKAASYRRTQKGVFGKNEEKKPYVDGWGKRKGNGVFQGKRLLSSNGRERIWSNGGAKNIVRRIGVADRGFGKNKKTERNLQHSLLLQGRHRVRENKDSDRGGWQFSQLTKGSGHGQEEGVGFGFVGLESVEIYEPRGNEQSQSLCRESTVYNIEVEDNHNYFANGILVHNCHQSVNPRGGQIMDFLNMLKNPRVLGFTATPFRMYPHFDTSMLKMITRTRPKIFGKLAYYVQIGDLKDRGFLCPTKYYSLTKDFDRKQLKVNSTGADYDEGYLRKYYDSINFKEDVMEVILRVNAKGRRVLAFVNFVSDAQYISESLEDSATVHALTPKAERERIEKEFKEGKIMSVVNCGTWTTGFDDEYLDCVLLARPLRSLSMYYQMFGRGLRFPADMPKKESWLIDLCGNMNVFGRVEELRVEMDKIGLPCITGTGGRLLTGVPLSEQEFPTDKFGQKL